MIVVVVVVSAVTLHVTVQTDRQTDRQTNRQTNIEQKSTWRGGFVWWRIFGSYGVVVIVVVVVISAIALHIAVVSVYDDVGILICVVCPEKNTDYLLIQFRYHILTTKASPFVFHSIWSTWKIEHSVASECLARVYALVNIL